VPAALLLLLLLEACRTGAVLALAQLELAAAYVACA
jgi:hypothetical protein